MGLTAERGITMPHEPGKPIPFRKPRRIEALGYRIAGRVFRPGQIEFAGEHVVTPVESHNQYAA
jgi:hypothetical protein